MKAVLLCGGEGVRLRPLTCHTPKPMLPLLGRPLLEYTLRHIRTHGVDHACLTLGYLPEEVLAIAKVPDLDMKLDFFTEDQPLGTAGAVAHAAGEIRTTFLVVSGDALTDMDLTAAVSFHKSTDALCTCILHREAEPSRFGVAVTDTHGKILKFQEKPHLSEAESFCVNTGIYILEPEVLSRIPKGRAYDFASDLFPELVREGRLYGYKSEGYWSDIGSPRAYLQAQEDLLEDRVLFAFPEGRFKRITVEEGAQIASSALLVPPVYIGKNAKIAEGCVVGPGSVIGEDVTLEERCGVKLSLIGRGSYLERNVQTRRMIADAAVHMLQDSRAFEGSILGTGSRLGRMSTLCAHTKIWPHKRIPDRTRVGYDVVFGYAQDTSLFANGKLSGIYGRDLPVAYLSRAALAIASVLPRGGRIALSCGKDEVSRSAAGIAAGAMNEQGIHAALMEEVPLPMLRDAVARMKLDAGLAISAQGRQLTLHILNAAGLDPDPRQLRRIDDALERMAEQVCADAVGKCLTVEGVREAYLRQCRKFAGRREAVPVRIESDEAIDPEWIRALGLARTHLPEEAQMTLTVRRDGWNFADETGKELDAPATRCAVFQAALQMGRIRGDWPMPTDCWCLGRDLWTGAQGVNWQLTASREEIWLRGLMRTGHSALLEDAGFFFDPYAAASLAASAFTKSQKPMSSWLRFSWVTAQKVSAVYDASKAYEVSEHLARLRAEAAEMFDGGMKLQGEEDVFVEWGGDEYRVRIYGNVQNRKRLQLLADTLLEC